jgi:hypothetical protein
MIATLKVWQFLLTGAGMRKAIIICSWACVIASLLYTPIEAKTTLTVTPVGVATIDKPGLTDDVEEILNKNGPFISNSFAMANLTGYPVGDSHIGAFPSMEFGIALGVGGTNMAYFDKNSAASKDGTLPGISPNAVLHFGFGLTEKTDVIGKVFVLNKSIIDPGVETDMIKLTHYNIVSAGGKFRYQLFGKQTILPFLFNFNGLTVSVGGDMMYGKVVATGDYDADFSQVTVNWGAGDTAVDLQFASQYEGSILWGIFAVSTQALAYFEVFGVFQPYTGFGLAANYGYFRINFDADGNITSNDPLYGGGATVATMKFLSKNAYTPYYVIPTYIVGLELNLWLVRITAETMANLYNLRDINAQLGLRFQF